MFITTSPLPTMPCHDMHSLPRTFCCSCPRPPLQPAASPKAAAAACRRCFSCCRQAQAGRRAAARSSTASRTARQDGPVHPLACFWCRGGLLVQLLPLLASRAHPTVFKAATLVSVSRAVCVMARALHSQGVDVVKLPGACCNNSEFVVVQKSDLKQQYSMPHKACPAPQHACCCMPRKNKQCATHT